eukprot:TRINITY_DN24099_c0_g1_i1.p1 TRINITY_DN24099_c0_g1~~TRINITY_DN24099_c0_g1_i1.p1  ORF type:complete len:217 (+),score=34.65 TRINITY_DN24099_c0_g1_i1:44-694(+)
MQDMLGMFRRGREQSLSPAERRGCHESIMLLVWRRTTVLILLMLLQSLSQFILVSYEKLVSEHVIIPLFLTMLVGAGGNAGNQAAVHSITGLVTGEYSMRSFNLVVAREAAVGFLCATILTCAAMARVYLFYDATEKFGDSYAIASILAICMSLFFIVLSSVILGASLPFFFERIGTSREHAAPVIQVIMDVLGVLITCQISHVMLQGSRPVSKSV